MESQNIQKALNHPHSTSITRGASPSVVNKQFETVAGFDGQGGFHGAGGHGGDQFVPRKMSKQVETAQITMMKQHLEAMKKLDTISHPVANQSQLSAQAYSKKQNLQHTNREQRANSYFQHNGDSTGQPSIDRHKKEYKEYKDLMSKVTTNHRNPSSIDLVHHSKSRHQRFATLDNSGNYTQPKSQLNPFAKQSARNPAGYGNFGPQMLTTDQYYGDKSAMDNFRNLSQIQKSKLPHLKGSQMEFDINDSIMRGRSEKGSSRDNLSENVFALGPTDMPQFGIRVNQLITGDKPPVQNPKNPQNMKLTELSDFKNLPNKSPSLFQQVPFWKNLNDQSIMSTAIDKSARKDTKYIDLDATQVSVNDPLMQNSIFTKRASPYPQTGNYDAVGTMRTMTEIDGGHSKFEPDDTFRQPNKSTRFADHPVKGDPTLQQTLNRIMSGEQFNQDGTYRTVTPFMGQQLSTDHDISNEIGKIHMYDSLLLGEKATPNKQRVKSEIRRKFMQNVARTKNSSIDVTQQFGQKMDISLPNRVAMRSINTGDLSPRGKLMAQMSERDGPQSDYASSSNISRNPTMMIGNQEVEIMKGSKLNQLSPITKKMNKVAKSTMDQIERMKKKQKANEELRETLWLKMQTAKHQTNENTDETQDEVENTAKAILAKNSEQIKILKNDLRSLVAPEEQKYQSLIADSPNYQSIDCLTSMLPVYLKLPASLMRSPMQFEILMGNVNALQVLISTEDKFPSEDKKSYEKESLLFRSLLLPSASKKDQQKQKKPQKNSILIIEASAAFNNQKPKDEAVIQKLNQHNANEGLKKRHFVFGKANFKENFDENDVIYVTIMSQNGGQIKIKSGFPNNYGGYGPADVIALYQKTGQKPKKEIKSPEDIVEELENWYQANLKCMDSYKYIYEAREDFTQLNKTYNLWKMGYQNQPQFHQQKMYDNAIKRENATNKAVNIYEANYYKNKTNLSKWEDYRENKIELTHIFIKVMKRKNFTRRWLIQHKAGQIFAKIIRNLFIRREMNRVLYASYHVAMRFKNTYLFKYRRTYGFDMMHRRKNELRRALNFCAMTKYGMIERDTTEYLAQFIFKTEMITKTTLQFTKKFENLIYMQAQKRFINVDRENRFEMIYQRLADYKEFFCSAVCYASKKNKKKPNPKAIVSNLKKMFPKKKRNEVSVEILKSQLALLDERNVYENKAFIWTIKARELTIVKQLLKLVTVKNEETKETIHKEILEEIQLEIEAHIKKIRKIVMKNKNCNGMEFNMLEKFDRQIFGITKKEIADNTKKTRFKSSPKEVFDIEANHKVSPAQQIKDSKSELPKSKKFIENLKAKRVVDKKKQRELALRGDTAEGDQDGEGDEDAEGMEGMEGAEDGMEGADDAMEGAEGEGMDGEGDAEGDAEGMEGADGEGMEGAEGEGMDGEGDAEGDAEGMDGEDGGSLVKDGSQAEIKDEGDPGSPGKSPAKKKKGSVSKGKAKKTKKEDPNKLDMLEYKKSDKTKKFILLEKVANPQVILDQIAEQFPKKEIVEPAEPLKEGEEPPKKEPHGVNAMTVQQIKELVHEMYYKTEKNKLKKNTLKKKLKFTETSLQKLLLHIALNFEIAKPEKDNNNDDIQTHLNNSPLPAETQDQAKQEPSDQVIAPVEVQPANEEAKVEEQPVENPVQKQEDEEKQPQAPPLKPLMMQPCLKKKSSGTGSHGDKKSQDGKSEKPPTPKEELKVEGSVAGGDETFLTTAIDDVAIEVNAPGDEEEEEEDE